MSETAAALSDDILTSLVGKLDVTTTLPTETEDLATSLSSRFLQVPPAPLLARPVLGSCTPDATPKLAPPPRGQRNNIRHTPPSLGMPLKREARALNGLHPAARE